MKTCIINYHLLYIYIFTYKVSCADLKKSTSKINWGLPVLDQIWYGQINIPDGARDVSASPAPPIQPHLLSQVLLTNRVLVWHWWKALVVVCNLIAISQLVEYKKKCLKYVPGEARLEPSVEPHLSAPIPWAPSVKSRSLSGLSPMICCCWGLWGVVPCRACSTC